MNHNIILVDDDSLTNYINKTILKRCLPGVEITEFSDTYKALNFLRFHAEKGETEFLILLDINMPDLTGWEVLEAIERGFPELDAKVVMLTSSIDQADREKAFTYERVISFVSKPIDNEKVYGILDAIAEAKTLDRRKASGSDLLEA